MNQSSIISFIALCFMTSLALFSSDIYLSSFPLMANSLNVGQDLIKLSLSFYLLGLCLCQVTIGYIMGYINKYKLSVLAILIFSLASLSIMFSSNLYLIFFLRFIQAYSAGVLTSTSRIIISQKSTSEGANSSFFAKVYISLGVAPLISPILGSLIATFSGWRNIFLFLAILGCLIFFFVNYLKKQDSHVNTLPKVNFVKLLSSYMSLFERNDFIRNAFIVGSSFVIYFTFLCQAPFVLNSAGLSVEYIGLLFVPISITYIIASLWHPHLARKIGVDKLVMLGLQIFMFGSISLVCISFLSIKPYWMLVPMCFMTFANGFLVPAATFRAMRSAMDMPAAASSLLGFLQLLPPIIGTVLLALLKVKTIIGVSLITLLIPLFLLFIPTLIKNNKSV